MSTFCPLYSGSSGNSFYLESNGTSLLIDLGVSCKSAVDALKKLGSSPQQLSAILITHEHSDHIKGLDVFLKKANIPIYASVEVIDYIKRNRTLPDNTKLIPVDMDGFFVNDIYIKPFSTPHDSLGSLGYRFKTNDNYQIGIATDLGYYSSEVHEGLSGSDLVVLESNYDDGMILVSNYPYQLKRRIMSNDGHLSNSECAKALLKLAALGTHKFILGHLSIENNVRELAEQTSHQILQCAGLNEGVDYVLQIANRKEITQPTLF